MFEHRCVDNVDSWVDATGDGIVRVDDVVDVIYCETAICALFTGYAWCSVQVCAGLLLVAARKEVCVLHEKKETDWTTTDEEVGCVEDKLVLR